jgi:hypothetical protein
MARITYVKKAQQRYKMVPVLNEDGSPKRTPVMGRNGQQKVTKRGKPVFMEITVADKSQPLPNRTCDHCHQEIKVGDPYKHISPKSGPYGGRTMYRCDICPNWHVWEYSSSLGARTAEIGFDFSNALDSVESEEDVQMALDDAASRVREIAEEKRESAQNIEDGFQHATYQSDELNDVADQLESWADEIEGATIPDFPEAEEEECELCEGTGEVEDQVFTDLTTEHEEGVRTQRQLEDRLKSLKVMVNSQPVRDLITTVTKNLEKTKVRLAEIERDLEGREAMESCSECDGAGRITPDEPTADQIEEWRDEVRNDLSIVDECPV